MNSLLESLECRTLFAGGALDTSFGGDGVVNTDLPGSLERITDLAVMTDGRIVVAGVKTAGSDGHTAFVARYHRDGTLDTTFDGDGIVSLAVSGLPNGSHGGFDLKGFNLGVFDRGGPRLGLGPNGSLLLSAGRQIFRFDASGAPDTAFDEDGVLALDYVPSHMIVRLDGNIVTGGVRVDEATGEVVGFVTMYAPDGMQIESDDGGLKADALFVTPNGDVYKAGLVQREIPGPSQSTKTELVVLGPDVGTSISADGLGTAVDLTVDAQGRMYALASTFKVIRFTNPPQAFPEIDTSFGTDGFASFPTDRRVVGREMILQADGKLLVAGFAQRRQGTPYVALARYNADGSLDTTFGPDGTGGAFDATGAALIDGFATALGHDGSIFVAGRSAENAASIARIFRDDAPAGDLLAKPLRKPAAGSHRFKIAWRDNVGVDTSSLDNGDIVVIGPGGAQRKGYLINTDSPADATYRVGLYKVAPFHGSNWTSADNGVYTVRVLSNHVFDTQGHAAQGRTLGTFNVNIAVTTSARADSLFADRAIESDEDEDAATTTIDLITV